MSGARPTTDTRAAAGRDVLEIEQRLRKAVQHFKPEQFAAYGARWYRKSRTQPQMLLQCPPHLLIQAIEANCTYYRPWHFMPFEHNGFAAAINVLNHFYDPYQRYCLETNNEFAFMQFMHRTQLSWQVSLSAPLLGRCVYLCRSRTATDLVASRFATRYGITPRRWAEVLLALYSSASKAEFTHLPNPVDRAVQASGLTTKDVRAVLREVSATPNAIEQRYRSLRGLGRHEQPSTPHLWSQLRPCLLSTPIMEFDDRYLVPIPELILRLLDSDIYERIRDLGDEKVRKELATRLERYVSDVLTHHVGNIAIVPELRQLPPSVKNCDLAFCVDGTLLLIECKCVSVRSRHVTDNAIQNHTAITEVASGMAQLADSRKSLQEAGGTLGRMPCIGIILTQGRIPMANTDTFWESCRTVVERDGATLHGVSAGFVSRPIVIDIEAFESLCIYLNLSGQSLLDLWEEKRISNPARDGDWPEFLSQRLAKLPPQHLPFWRDLSLEMFDSITEASDSAELE